ncbi:MAG TPA: DUF3560 domain-containing protein [Acidimicrobiales bacterium]
MTGDLITCAGEGCRASFYNVPGRDHADLCLDHAEDARRAEGTHYAYEEAERLARVERARSDLTLTYSAAEGTILTGDCRPHQDIAKRYGFRWSPKMRTWYLPNSRDRIPDAEMVAHLVADFHNVGLEVAVQIGQEARSVAERESDRSERLAARADRLSARSDRLSTQAGGEWERARQMADVIPFGQPIMVGHHSEGRDRNYRAKVGRSFDRAMETHTEAEETARAARVARAEMAHREGAPATIRRIERLEVQARDYLRRLDAHPEHAERYRAELAAVADELAYWRAHLANLEAAGVKMWGPADFRKGDRVNGSATVIRVNAKTLTVHHDVWPASFRHPLPYDKVRSVERPAGGVNR